ncbi:hypothetical protein GCM10027046_13890 [Uliginosibacterium flavum]
MDWFGLVHELPAKPVVAKREGVKLQDRPHGRSSNKPPNTVIPAKAGIQKMGGERRWIPDRVRNDGLRTGVVL